MDMAGLERLVKTRLMQVLVAGVLLDHLHQTGQMPVMKHHLLLLRTHQYRPGKGRQLFLSLTSSMT